MRKLKMKSIRVRSRVLRATAAFFSALALAVAGLGVVALSANAATVNATLSPSSGAPGWNSNTLTFSMTTQTQWTSYSTVVSGGGGVSIESNYTIDFVPTSPCASGVCPGISMTVTKPDTSVLALPNAQLSDYTAAFGARFGTDASNNPIVVPAGSVITFTFDPHTVYFRSAASNFKMVVTTYLGSPYTVIDQSPWTTVFNSVTFHSNYGADTTTVQGGLTATNLSAAPSRSGYVFQGWSLTSSGSIAYANQASFDFSAAASTHLYAMWAVAPQTVTFNANDSSGSPATSTQTSTGATALTTNAFTRAGYSFAGWATTSGGAVAYTNGASYPFSSTATLYAKWTANSNVVTFDSHGGSSVADGSFTTGGTLTFPPAPTRSGYSFNGWFGAATGGSALTSGYSPTQTTAFTLHAQWSPLARTATFDANGGLGSMTAQSSGSAAALTANTFSRNGHYFDGWNTLANGGGTDIANSANYDFVSNVTLYAKWRAIPLVPTAAVSIQVPVGQPIANAPVALQADGLKDQTGYTVTVFSTPQIIDQGTIWSGRLNTTVRIPSNLEAGWHRLVLDGTAADGTPWTETSYFKVTASGLLDATSDTIPAELVVTGAPDPSGTITLSVVLLSMGLLLSAGAYRLRRRITD